MTSQSSESRLRAIKLAHTVVWAFFASCVLGIPLAAYQQNFALACSLIGIVALESLVLLLNSWRCPLTDLAAQHTERREANFDIHLPLWLARYNKQIFGTLYLGGSIYTLLAWLRIQAS